MRWAIEIQKTSLDERMLSDILGALNTNLVQGINFPKALSSSEIDSCSTSQDAIEIARKIRSILKITEVDSEFSLGAVIDLSVNPPTSHHFLEVDSCFINVTTFMSGTLTVSPPSELSDEKKQEWIKNQEEQQYQVILNEQLSTLIPAYSNPNAAKVIELLSLDPQTGESLYKIYELMESHPNNRDKFQKDFNITKETFNRFGSAVHNPSVTGDWARHAYDKKPVPNPMTKAEAEEFIRALAKKWFETIRKEFEKN
jgi:hypothetical protein